MLGVIALELLDGVKLPGQFKLLAEYLQNFPLIEPSWNEYIEAARLKAHCRSRGITISNTDAIIAQACISRNFPVLTTDRDFLHIASCSDLYILSKKLM
jgi:predicted nucleic acid-binding protein